MHIRSVHEGDVEVLANMRVDMLCEHEDYTEAFRAALFENTVRYIREGLDNGSYLACIALEDDEVVAMGGISLYTLPPNDWCLTGRTAYVGNMYTVPAHRGMGTATRILERLVEEAKSLGCERIALDATDAGRPLYEKNGFDASHTYMANYPFGKALEQQA